MSWGYTIAEVYNFNLGGGGGGVCRFDLGVRDYQKFENPLFQELTWLPSIFKIFLAFQSHNIPYSLPFTQMHMWGGRGVRSKFFLHRTQKNVSPPRISDNPTSTPPPPPPKRIWPKPEKKIVFLFVCENQSHFSKKMCASVFFG